MKKAFITGISGQDGSFLAELLLEKGYEVHGMIRRNSNFEIIPNIEHIRNQLNLHHGDVTDGATLRKLIMDIRPAEVYNLAAQSHVAVSFEVPVFTAETDAIGTLNVLEAVRALVEDQRKNNEPETRFYQASTSELFGKVQEVPQTESTPFYPRSPYGCAKLYAHWMTIVKAMDCMPVAVSCSIMKVHVEVKLLSHARLPKGSANCLQACVLDDQYYWATWMPNETGAMPKTLWKACV